jgi:hypothetical protein
MNIGPLPFRFAELGEGILQGLFDGAESFLDKSIVSKEVY